MAKGPTAWGSALMAARKAKGVARRALADELGTSPTMVRNWELGLRQASPDARRLAARALEAMPAKGPVAGLTPAQILGARSLLGMSREGLAREVGVTAPALRNWELGLSAPRPENQRRLLAALRRLAEERLEDGEGA